MTNNEKLVISDIEYISQSIDITENSENKGRNKNIINNTNKLVVTSEQSSYYWTKEPVINLVNSNKLEDNRFTLVDLFCGAGGLSKGFEMTHRFKPILGVDIFTCALDTYRRNNVDASTILGDIRNVSNEQFRQVLGNQKIDVVSAGIPCQGFSISNRNRITNDVRNFLFLEVIRFVNEFNPKVVVIENVSGMKSLENGQFIEAISHALMESGTMGGYSIKHGFLNAADFGVPQLRKRLFFVATRNDLTEFNFPKAQFGENAGKPYNTIRDAIGDLPYIESGEATTEYILEPQTEYQVLMRKDTNILYNHVSPRHPQETIDKIRHTLPGEPMYERYRQRIRLAWDIQSPTQLAGGIRPQFQFGHPEIARGLTVRERARIQSFPDDYEFLGGTVQGRVQTGNAVPPLLAKAIATQIFKVIE